MKRSVLGENELPRSWYNIAADLPEPLRPPLDPGTGKPIGPEQLAAIFPMPLLEQEMSAEREIAIPEPVLDVYAMWRPTPLIRAVRLEQHLGTPAKIFYKYEGASPPGSHKPNTAVAQAYYNKISGIERLATETGAGQWGSALAFACSLFDMALKVYMVRVSYEQKPYRRSLIQTWGGEIVPSPSPDTPAGRQVLEATPDSPGSLGIAISEAVQDAAHRDDTNYSLGSVLNHVLLHQTVIGLEAQRQFRDFGLEPDVVIGCVGGGSNFGGIALPYVREKIHGKPLRAIAVEPEACPSITRGHYHYDFGDTAQTTPLMAMHTLGHSFVPPGIHAGGLRYHGMAPLISHLVELDLVEPQAPAQLDCFAAAVTFARTEGVIPAPETAHAVQAAIAEAERCKREGSEETILFGFSGHGFFDMSAYDAYFAEKLTNYQLPEDALARAWEAIRELPKP
ncbi:MAG: TrpB-like pyridoxal phosphate-dependent enzyme [Candidatus Eisenbacteria bacterium]|nr:TrpB-like pyridoxal phosphate-dependent enzyme [Candidatus Eisenbacteria bacterium]